jgi:hypothetical protein
MKKVELFLRKTKSIILGLMFLPAFIHAQNLEKCPDVVVLPKVLYDSFQNMKANLDEAEREMTIYRGAKDDIQKKFLGCEKQADVAAMLRQAEQSLETAETNRKKWFEAFTKVDGEVRDFILAAGRRPVAYRFYESGYGQFGRVATMTFSIPKDKVVIIPSYYELPDPATR